MDTGNAEDDLDAFGLELPDGRVGAGEPSGRHMRREPNQGATAPESARLAPLCGPGLLGRGFQASSNSAAASSLD